MQNTLQDKLLLIAQTLIATAMLILCYDREDGVPVLQFGLVFAGFLLGHVLTLVLEDKEEE